MSAAAGGPSFVSCASLCWRCASISATASSISSGFNRRRIRLRVRRLSHSHFVMGACLSLAGHVDYVICINMLNILISHGCKAHVQSPCASKWCLYACLGKAVLIGTMQGLRVGKLAFI